MELTTFRLRDGVDEAAFLEADAAAQAFHHRQPGLVRRTTLRDLETGEWLVVTLWGSWEHAETAAEAGRTDAHMQAFDALVDPASVQRRRFETLD